MSASNQGGQFLFDAPGVTDKIPVMKAKSLLWSVCALGLLAGCGKQAEEARQRAEKELETVRAELEQVKTERGNIQTEVERLRKDNTELLRLRNEVRRLSDEGKKLAAQAQNATAQAQHAQNQIHEAQAQVQAAQNQAQTLTTNLEAMKAITARYGAAASVMTPEQQLNACINNLRMIDGAIQQWALENKKTAQSIATERDIVPYLKDGVLPKCPSGGTYTIGAVGAAPTCSSHAVQ